MCDLRLLLKREGVMRTTCRLNAGLHDFCAELGSRELHNKTIRFLLSLLLLQCLLGNGVLNVQPGL